MSLAAADKLLKIFEALKNYRDGIPVVESNPLAKKKEVLLSKKDRLSYIGTIPDLVCSSQIKSLQEFPKLLAIAVDSLLASCNDDESDVRLVAGEALNKLIKDLISSNLARLLVELYKEIKKNDAARSLKVALTRFADIAHLIRPQKCRPFVANLLPCLGRVCARTEDSLQEALAVAIQKVFPVLGSFTSDAEVKQLMKAFIPNLKCNQATTRRTASSCLAIICQHSRKPNLFYEWVMNVLLGMVLPLQESKPSHVYLGVLTCLRHLIPHLEDSLSKDDMFKGSFGPHRSLSVIDSMEQKEVNLKQLLQIYEVIMHCSRHIDHNVINASLETLHQLLRTPPKPLLNTLLSKDGITPSLKPDTIAYDDIESASEKDSAVGDLDTMSTLPQDSESVSDLSSTSDFASHDGSASIATTLSTANSTDELSVKMSKMSSNSLTERDSQTDLEEMIESEQEDVFGSEIDNVSGPRPSRSFSDPGVVPEEENYRLPVSTSHNDSCQVETEIPENPLNESDRINDDLGELNQVSEALRTESVNTQEIRALVESSFEVDTVACEGVPMVHIARVMSSFLLSGRPGEVLSDSNVRVSVKSLALSCIAQAVRLYPESFLAGVLPNNSPEGQLIRDILLFNAHPDPQLRGGLALVLSHLTIAGLTKGRLNFNHWSEEYCSEHNIAVVSIERVVSVLGGILQDDSPVAVRQACSALKGCLPVLCSSEHCNLVQDLIDVIVQLRKNSYWLVKVEVLELVEAMDFKLIVYLESNKMFHSKESKEKCLNHTSIQDTMLHDVVFSMLSDEDGRVRHAAASCCVKLIPKLLMTTCNSKQQSILKTVCERLDELDISGDRNQHSQILLNLSKVVSMATEMLYHTTSKFQLVGCIHLLHVLAQSYPVASYPASWACTVAIHSSSSVSPHMSGRVTPTRPGSPNMSCTGGGGVLSFAVSSFTSSWIAYDLVAHQNLLQLAGHLLFGIAASGIQLSSNTSQRSDDSAASTQEAWSIFSDISVAPIAEKVIVHLIRMLHIFAHLIDGITPGTPSFKINFPGQNKDKQSQSPSSSTTASLQSATAVSSHVSAVPKRLLKSKRTLSEADLSNAEKSPSKSGGGGQGGDSDQTHPHTPPPKSTTGAVCALPHYMKLYDVLKGTYCNYQVSLAAQDKFVSFLQSTLDVLARFMEIAPFHDIEKYIEEILGYLQVCVKVEPCKTFLSVQQLLRAMFGVNAVSQPELGRAPVFPGCLEKTLIPLPANRLASNGDCGLYQELFERPQRVYHQSIEKVILKDEEPDSSLKRGIGSLFKKIRIRTGSIIRPSVKIDKQSPIHSFIRLFEPLVIRALKEFTVSTSISLQQHVLSLLAQLIKLRVNYALLDADQVFISYVQKQFEFVDAGQIKNCDVFLPFVFQFLVLLSYDCYQPKFNQAKAIVGMPKVIQLCDGLMASGQSAKTHAVPALQPIVHDLFVLRTLGKADSAKEVETQREVVISMLLRFVQHYEVLEMLIMVLSCYQREDDDKWKKMSRQVIDLVLPVLAKQQIFVDNESGFAALEGMFQSVSQVALRPADVLLKVLFMPTNLTALVTLQRWLSMVLVLLHAIQGHVSEEQLLSRMKQMNIKANVLQRFQNETMSDLEMEEQHLETPEKIFSMFLLQAIYRTTKCIVALSNATSHNACGSTKFLNKQFCRLAVSVNNMFKSENYSRITMATSYLSSTKPMCQYVVEINESLEKIIPTHPVVVFHWATILRCLCYDVGSFWCKLIQTSLPTCQDIKESHDTIQPINREITKQAAILLYCDLLVCKEMDQPCSSLTEVSVLLQSYLEDLIQLDHEPPVARLFSILHKNADGSRTVLETFIASYTLKSKKQQQEITFTRHLVSCLSNVHSSQTCLLLKILAEFFLDSYHRSITRFVESNICKRLEVEISRLRDPNNETSTEELTAVCRLMASKKHIQRNPRLCSLVHHVLDLNKVEKSISGQLVSSMQMNTIDQEWYTQLVSHCCFVSGAEDSSVKPQNPQETIHLLSILSFTAVCNIMSDKNFDISLLEDCILHGVERTLHFTSRRLSIEENASKPYENTEHFESTGVDHLLLAAKLTMFRHMYQVVNDVVTTVPCEAQEEDQTSSRIVIDKGKYMALYKDNEQCILDLARAIISYCAVVISLPRQCKLSEEEINCLCRFIFLPLSMLYNNFMDGVLPNTFELKVVLNCLGKILMMDYTQSVNNVEYVTLICQAINQVYTLIKAVSLNGCEKLAHESSTENSILGGFDSADEFQSITLACDQISDLISYTYTYLRPGSNCCSVLPQFLYEPFRLTFLGLARRPLVNSYARTPPIVWKLGWMPTPEGPLKTELPPLPIEILKEKDVLSEFVMRVNILGWISRQQFEETWAALLGVLSSPPLPENVTPEEDMEASHSCCLAVRCIASLLLQTTLYPYAGNCSVGGYLHSPRHRDLPFLGSRAGKKLSVVRALVEEEFVNTCCIGAGRSYLTREDVRHEQSASFHHSSSFMTSHGNASTWTSNKLIFDNPLYGLNVERILGFHDYTFGQLSINGLHSQAQAQLQEYPDSEDDAAIIISMPRMPKPEKLDIRSCLQFLLELFEQWMSPYVQPRTPLMLLSEATKALVVFSDLFIDGNHFEWVLDTLLDLYQNHPTEDDLLTQYSLPVICKALAFLKIEGPTAEKVCKIIETSLRSPHVPLQMSALYGSMYILESHVPSVATVLIPILTDHLGKRLNSLQNAVMFAQQHLLVMWSAIFFLIEHYNDEISDADFKPKVLKAAVHIASSTEETTPLAVYQAIMRGLERLVVSFALSSNESDSLVKLSVDRLSIQNPQRSISALGLLITCMYTGKIGDRPSGIYTTEFPTEDRLLIAMERVTVLFDKIRKGFQAEAQIVSRVLPRLLLDFFPSQEIMNKVIGEFLSSQQPHPELMAEVLFKVFEGLHGQGQQAEVSDWVVLSLGSFVQRTPLSMAVWSLSCFFISASTSRWIRALFPYVLGRMNRLEEIDQKFFCAFAVDFYKNQNLDASQKKNFVTTFKNVSTPGSPYSLLTTVCERQT